MKNTLMRAILASVMLAPFFAPAAVYSAEESKVAMVEEIEFLPDGSQRVVRYRPGEPPVFIDGPAAAPRQRGLNSVEKMELDQLEADFAHGKISESEYYSRKRAILRATYMDGSAPDDGLFNQSTSF